MMSSNRRRQQSHQLPAFESDSHARDEFNRDLPVPSGSGLGLGQYSTRSVLRRESSGTNNLIREAKKQSAELKAMLKTHKDPWDRSIEFQREALRKVYLQILFTSPTSSTSSAGINTGSGTAAATTSTSKPPPPPSSSSTVSISSHTARLLNVLNLLWLETSHAAIHLYRAKLTSMDSLLASQPSHAHRRGRNSHHHHHPQHSGPPHGNGGAVLDPTVGPTARRKLVQSFRQFLTREEEFYRTLIARFSAGLYASDVGPMKPLGINVDLLSEEEEEEGVVVVGEGERKKRRAEAVPLAHKALIYLGDIERYKELYNQSSSGGANGKKAGGGGGRGGGGAGAGGVSGNGGGNGAGGSKVKNWTKAAECYQQARFLMPDNGNPSNQLAVLSQYSSDFISSTYYYHRALAVRQPFPTARTNLEIAYAKSVTRFFADEDGGGSGGGGGGGGRGEPEGDEGVKFKADFVVLHGLFFCRTMPEKIPELSERVRELFQVSVEERLLPTDILVKTVVTGLCALWDARMFRSGGKKSQSQSAPSQTSPSASQSMNLEPQILLHVLSTFRVLLHLGARETNDLLHSNTISNPTATTSSTTTDALALNISAALRRALPALRILNKWLMGQLEYISRVVARSGSRTSLTVALEEFWTSYAECANAFQVAFPVDQLPNAVEGEVWLEEDVDLLGFAPLRRGMKEGVASADGTPVEIGRVGKSVHPNEEQLMRIGEVLRDATLMAKTSNASLAFVNGQFTIRSASTSTKEDERQAEVEPEPQHLVDAVDELAIDEDEFEFEEEATEDDPIDLVMRIATADRMQMDDDDDFEEEEEDDVVYGGALSSRGLSIGNPSSAMSGSFGPPGIPMPRGPSDLRHQVFQPGVSPTPPPGLPSSPTGLGGRSIWAPTPLVAGSALPPATATSIGSFESLPNTTHQHAISAAFTRQSSSTGTTGVAAASLPLPPPHYGAGSAFGAYSPFGSPARPSAVRTPSSTSPNTSDLSPHASHWKPQAQPSRFSG